LWGTGWARREFLNVDDLADALLFLMDRSNGPGIINVGTGMDLTIRELASKIALAAGYKGNVEWDSTMPDGMARKCMDVSRITSMGWRPRIRLEDGITRLVEEYRAL
jgi:GDP-L-fucose synthase